MPDTPPLAQSWLELPDGRTFWLTGRTSIGRQGDNDLVLNAHTISRRHALLSMDASGYVVSDLHSSNGTYVNGMPITRVTSLRDGDDLRFGDAVVRYRCLRTAETSEIGRA